MLFGFVIINKSELVCTSTDKYKEFVDHEMTLKYKEAVFFDRCEMVFFKSTYYLRRGFQGIQGILWSKPGGVRCLSFQLARRISSCFGPYSQVLSPHVWPHTLRSCRQGPKFLLSRAVNRQVVDMLGSLSQISEYFSTKVFYSKKNFAKYFCLFCSWPD